LSRFESAHAAATEGLELARQTDDLVFQLQNAAVLGFLELSRGNPAEANRYLGPLPQMFERMGSLELWVFSFHPNAVEALVTLGQVDEADDLLSDFENRALELSRVGAVATARRCRGITESARGNLAEADDILADAIARHESLPYPFERARTLLAAGSLNRRLKKKARSRDLLGEALELFDGLGAKAWAERTRAELGRIGGRAPSQFELTPTENDIARLTAEGLTNREIAERMFLSSKTVESNLSRVYRKLGIRSRTELAHLASEGKLIGIGSVRNGVD
jgi:DNA-binding CsgD family transcriptional regulator